MTTGGERGPPRTIHLPPPLNKAERREELDSKQPLQNSTSTSSTSHQRSENHPPIQASSQTKETSTQSSKAPPQVVQRGQRVMSLLETTINTTTNPTANANATTPTAATHANISSAIPLQPERVLDHQAVTTPNNHLVSQPQPSHHPTDLDHVAQTTHLSQASSPLSLQPQPKQHSFSTLPPTPPPPPPPPPLPPRQVALGDGGVISSQPCLQPPSTPVPARLPLSQPQSPALAPLPAQVPAAPTSSPAKAKIPPPPPPTSTRSSSTPDQVATLQRHDSAPLDPSQPARTEAVLIKQEPSQDQPIPPPPPSASVAPSRASPAPYLDPAASSLASSTPVLPTQGHHAETNPPPPRNAFRSALARDHLAVLRPDTSTPFSSPEDVVARLLPYHVFNIPHDDLLRAVGADPSTVRRGRKRSRREFQSADDHRCGVKHGSPHSIGTNSSSMVKPIKTEEEQTVVVEQEGSPLDPMDDHGLPSIPESDFPPFGFVARCFKRRSALLERFKRLQLAMSTAHLRAPYHSASVEQLERMAYDDERKDVLDRIEELKALKAELEEKEKQYYRPGELSDQVSLSFQITDEIEREREREKEKERQKRQALAAQARAEAKAAAAAAKGLDTGVSGEKTKPSPSKAQAPKSPSPQKGQTVAATTPLTGVLLDPFTEMTQGRLQQPGQVDAALVAPSVRGTPPYPPSTPIVGHRGPGRPRIHHPPPTTPYTSIAGETSSGPKKKSSLDASKKSRPPPRPLPAQTPPTTSSSPYGPQMVGGGNSASSYPRPPTVNGGPMQQPRPDFGVRPQMAQQPRPPFAMPSPAYPQHQPPPPQQRPPPAHMSSSPHPSSQPTYHAQPPPPHHQQQQYHQSHQAPPPSSGGPPPPHMPQPRPNPAPPQASVIPKSPIPLLIPLAALPRLTALGIQPVPAPHLVPILSETGQPMSLGGPPRPANPNQQEAAVLMGITQATARAANGKLQAQQILHISVVLSKLTSAQLSGLAALMQGLQLEVEQARAAAGSNQPGGGRGPSNPPSRPATGSQPPA